MIGIVLQGRYQIVQSLGAGVFGQTYIAVDIESPNNPKCVVKQLKVTSTHSSYLETLRLRFLTETETLKHLGHHEQIPQLISCFEENERFYLVQEFIEGHSLTAELPIDQSFNYLWSEGEVVEFLQDVLGVLEFVHAQGVIHCDVKPENLIRRAYDGKLVLIDFGSIQPVDFGLDSVLPIYRIPVTSLGYIPPEQFIGQTKPNSDIYAVGMIAIQALTGLSPLQLKVDPHTNEIIWRFNNIPISDYLAAILSQMVRYNSKDRSQSVGDVLQALAQMQLESQAQTVEAHYTLLQSGEEGQQKELTNINSGETSTSSPLLTGMKVGLAANSLLLGFGVYSLVNSSPAYSETETATLYKATEEYQAGDLEKAIALAKSIPTTSDIYPEAQATIDEWQNQWQTAAEKYKVTEQAFNEGRWLDVLRLSPQVPDILYWQLKTDKLVEQAHTYVEAQSKELLAKAYTKAAARDFSGALNYLNQIPKETDAGSKVQQKMTEYSHKRQVRASYFLQKAYNQAAEHDFHGAVKFLQQVPKDSAVYATAQAKLVEYGEKQRLQAEGKAIAKRSTVAALEMVEPFINHSPPKGVPSFEPVNQLEEVNIR